MKTLIRWNDKSPVRSELFSVERLTQHAESLAKKHSVTTKRDSKNSVPLIDRLNDNSKALLAIYNECLAGVEKGEIMTPAMDWLLGNYHVVETHIWNIRVNLPASYYNQLPKLTNDEFAGYPRVFSLMWDYVAHTDSRFDRESLCAFLQAYQKIQPLTIGELWAVPTTLSIVLIENLRRLGTMIRQAARLRVMADDIADTMLGLKESAEPVQESILAVLRHEALSYVFVEQLSKRFRDPDPKITSIQTWLDENLQVSLRTMESLIIDAQQLQYATNISVQNIVVSMRHISDSDWSEIFESVSLVDGILQKNPYYAQMDFPSRNMYRSAIEEFARYSDRNEVEIAELVLDETRNINRDETDEREKDLGYYLLDKGRPIFEAKVGFKPPLYMRLLRIGKKGGVFTYFAVLLLVTALLLYLTTLFANYVGLVGWKTILLVVFGLLPASEAATALVNLAVSKTVRARILPTFEMKAGIPAEYRTMVVIPTLLLNEESIHEQVRQLEIHYLASPMVESELYYALLTDWCDASQEKIEKDDHLLSLAKELIDDLNQRHEAGSAGKRFNLYHRRRLFNHSENCWMGWERKRGKLEEFNRLVLGEEDTSYMMVDKEPITVPPGIRYIITLDSDTRLPIGAVEKLVGKLAHPLNQARFCPVQKRVIAGYGIIQPRVTPAFPVARETSLYQIAFSAPGGHDPYASAVSDVYQDLFGEGSFTGKGIYDVRMFDAALSGRIAENKLLSHDLFEGIFARSAFASDVEFVEESPARYDVAAKREHRWIRGDWQLLPWIFSLKSSRKGGVTPLGRWKMIDNLRRSLVFPTTFLAFIAAWFLAKDISLSWTVFLLFTIALPSFVPLLFAVLPHKFDTNRQSHFRALRADFSLACLQIGLKITFLADYACLLSDAVLRTLYRLFFSHKHMLQWVSSMQAGMNPHLTIKDFYKRMGISVSLSILVFAALVISQEAVWWIAAPLILLWVLAPVIAWRVSWAPDIIERRAISEETKTALHQIARNTWRFFEVFVTPEENMLPPDNFQYDPEPVVAARTSPTNIGLYLLSTAAARDFGWISTTQMVERLEKTFETLQKLERYRGHFYNWYDTRTLDVLTPAYVSTVDSGNLAGHLIALANSCEARISWFAAREPTLRSGLRNTAELLRDTLKNVIKNESVQYSRQIIEMMSVCRALIKGCMQKAEDPLHYELDLEKAEVLVRQMKSLSAVIENDQAILTDTDLEDIIFWVNALVSIIDGYHRDQEALSSDRTHWTKRLQDLADISREISHAMEFRFLYNEERQLLSIGFNAQQNVLDESCYDLLASEARLTSMIGIAKGELPVQHWFRLGRSITTIGKGAALISWSGSMFEYLMPTLVMREPSASLLGRTNALVVAEQEAYGRSLSIPWGISESGYIARDMEYTYQYSNFGVPSLGLKQGLNENTVIAPYATGLASMVDPEAAVVNYRALEEIGARGRYGFYEAVDFTKSRLPEGKTHEVVYSHMAHHQGMTLIALTNILKGARMRVRFHTEPMIEATELLLQERVPRNVVVFEPQAEKFTGMRNRQAEDAHIVRRLGLPKENIPVIHTLSNGVYHAMISSAGSGISAWNDSAISRWRNDCVRDNNGYYFYLKDRESKEIWSSTYQPLAVTPNYYDVMFAEEKAEFIRNDGDLTTETEIIVSAEHNAEVRRISIANHGRSAKTIEVTSFMELVLTRFDTEVAHPVFAKMFIQTEFLPEYDALIATRRKRSPGDLDIWIAHMAVAEGHEVEPMQYETDRSRFIGRGKDVSCPSAVFDNDRLSGTTGTVLDPVFSIRKTVKVLQGRKTSIDFWIISATSREELIDIIDKYRSSAAYERVATLAWTQARVQLRHIDIDAREAADFQKLGSLIFGGDYRLRLPSGMLAENMGNQSELWPHSISGDWPIVVVRIDDVEDMDVVRQIIKMQEYYRLKGSVIDIVIVNERAASYIQDLQHMIEAEVRSSQFGVTHDARRRGNIYVLRADLLSMEKRMQIYAAARVILNARKGMIERQLALLEHVEHDLPVKNTYKLKTKILTKPDNLEFFNGYGGFAQNGQEYVIILENGQTTPAPWINVISNENFGFQVSADGAGYTWNVNSREFKLTPWSNDPTCDPAGEAIYIRDFDTGALFSPTSAPIRDDGTYIIHHGWGYSVFEHEVEDIALNLVQFVAQTDPVKFSRLKLTNNSTRTRKLSVTAYAEWLLEVNRAAEISFKKTEIDKDTKVLMTSNPWNIPFGTRVAFLDMMGMQESCTGNRKTFIGRNGSLKAPIALSTDRPLSNEEGGGMDSCGAMQQIISLEPGETKEIVIMLGAAEDRQKVLELVQHWRKASLDDEFNTVCSNWKTLLTAVKVKTPDRAMDIMLNGWLLYQSYSCRILARSAFYQSSGAYGFRDQMQDCMAFTPLKPERTRAHLLRAAGRQFVEGDVQHWWLPHSGQGVRSLISDDRVWLSYCVANYIITTDDYSVLDEEVPFLEGQLLKEHEHDAFFQPMVSAETASLFEHCARGLDQCIELTGEHGLPLIGGGDWNDGMNLVGAQGKGESTWLGWFFITTVRIFAPLVEAKYPERVQKWRDHADSVLKALEGFAWDGTWYRRGVFDDGSLLGSADNEECQIDSLPQSWAVLSRMADQRRSWLAMDAVDKHLIRYDEQIACLFTPPFDKTAQEPGYIKGYPPGLRENGGQYSHAAMWIILALAEMGDGDRAANLFSLLNPIKHSMTREKADHYKVEPFVVAADVYSVAPHAGRGGWTWYTGAAAWMFRAGMEGIMGLAQRGNTLRLAPAFASSWKNVDITISLKDTLYKIHIFNPNRFASSVRIAELDGRQVELVDGIVHVPLDGKEHELTVWLGPPERYLS